MADLLVDKLVDMHASGRNFPGFGELYALMPDNHDLPYVATNDSDDEFRLLRAEVEVPNRQSIGRIKGEPSLRPGSVMYTTMGFPLFVAAGVVKALSEAGVTGWRSTPVQLRHPSGRAIEGYELFQVTGRCGPEEEKRSSIELRKFPGGNYPVRVGLYFDPATWDGSDIFMPSNQVSFIFLTERAKAVMEAFADGAINFERLDRIETPLPEEDGAVH